MARFTRKPKEIVNTQQVAEHLQKLLPSTRINIEKETQAIGRTTDLLSKVKVEIVVTRRVLESIRKLKDVEKPLKDKLKVLESTLVKLNKVQQVIVDTGIDVVNPAQSSVTSPSTEESLDIQASNLSEDISSIQDMKDFS